MSHPTWGGGVYDLYCSQQPGTIQMFGVIFGETLFRTSLFVSSYLNNYIALLGISNLSETEYWQATKEQNTIVFGKPLTSS